MRALCCIAIVAVLGGCPFVGAVGTWSCKSDVDCLDGVCSGGSCVEHVTSTSTDLASSSGPVPSSSAASSSSSAASSSSRGSSSRAVSSSSLASSSSSSAGCTPGAQCSTGLAGQCALGMLECSPTGNRCVPLREAGPETCANPGTDDDCDGNPLELVNDVDADAPCTSISPGICGQGTAHWECPSENSPMPVCVDDVAPRPETCADMGTDDNCNGDATELINGVHVDDPCMLDATVEGQCRMGGGRYQCSGGMLACAPTTQPQQETCFNRGVDDNCDGDAFEVWAGATEGSICPTGSSSDECRMGTLTCMGAGPDGAPICQPPAGTREVCDGRDNDCDGTIDECRTPGFACGLESDVSATQSCGCANAQACDGGGNTGFFINCNAGYCALGNGGWSRVCARGEIVVDKDCKSPP